MAFWRKTMLFSLGGCLYMGLELLWRRRTHGTMFLAGGLCFTLLGRIRRFRANPILKAGIGAGIITLVELGAGMLWNRDHRIWDYRDRPGNFRGQICPLFTLLWIPVSAAGMALHQRLTGMLP